MGDFARLLLLLAIVAAAITAAGAAAVWLGDERRRLTGALRRDLDGRVDAILLTPGRARGVALGMAAGTIVVAWDKGAWRLLYPLHEIDGAELILDGMVEARVRRDEPRRALDRLSGAEEQVSLRLLFDDPARPEFMLDLWQPEDAGRRDGLTAKQAIQLGNQWLARVEAILRRPPPRRTQPTQEFTAFDEDEY